MNSKKRKRWWVVMFWRQSGDWGRSFAHHPHPRYPDDVGETLRLFNKSYYSLKTKEFKRDLALAKDSLSDQPEHFQFRLFHQVRKPRDGVRMIRTPIPLYPPSDDWSPWDDPSLRRFFKPLRGPRK